MLQEQMYLFVCPIMATDLNPGKQRLQEDPDESEVAMQNFCDCGFDNNMLTLDSPFIDTK